MKLSQYFLPTLREDPAEAEVASHKLLLRAGYIRQLAAGIYSYLPLAQRSLLKIQNIIREEMDAVGAQEFYLPALHPAELWQATNRWDVMGENMFRLKDRWGRDMCLGMTHEEVFTWIAKNELRSYRDLPQIWYQIQTKFRDEPRPKSGLLRVRQFTMKDSYTFDMDEEGLDKSYNKHYDTYNRIYTRCGLEYFIVEAHSGPMGGSHSHEFMVPSDAGEDFVATCKACGYAANLEKASGQPTPVDDTEPERNEIVKIATPGHKTIDEIYSFLGVEPSHQIKTLLYIVESKPLMILLRGDHQLSESKLETVIKTSTFRPAQNDEIIEHLGASAGSLGPVGVKNIQIIADYALKGRKNMTTGANEDGYHIQGVTPDVHFKAEYYDLRVVENGDGCPQCGAPLEIVKTIEVGHIFKLGTKYSKSMDATVLNKDGNKVPIVMGSYGIGVERILSAAVELFNDEKGIILPITIAPFEVIITPVSIKDNTQSEICEKLYEDLKKSRIDVLYDDRDERAGVKFNDADLIGVPIRITLGPKKLRKGLVEIITRKDGSKIDIKIEETVNKTKEIVDNLKAEIRNRVNKLKPIGRKNE